MWEGRDWDWLVKETGYEGRRKTTMRSWSRERQDWQNELEETRGKGVKLKGNKKGLQGVI